MAVIGYARVSTEDQTPLPQADELRTAATVRERAPLVPADHVRC
jgi:DNA invertase Pin-like site-specific DNA recombinase